MTEVCEFAAHGGALDAARRTFPSAPQPWIDLSTGINPISYPVADIAADIWRRLPDASAISGLERVAAVRYGAPDRASIVAAPGAQAIIQLLPSLAIGRDVRCLGPTYGEFERVFSASGTGFNIVASGEALVGADLAVIVNPNNPDGCLCAPEALLRLASRVGMLIVDESFADGLAPTQSVVSHLAGARIMVLRSFGKIYGLAGLRLGFALGPADRCDTLRRMLGPWPVSGPAITIGTQALADEAWLAATRTRLREDGMRLGRLLARAGTIAIGDTPLFRLVSHPGAPGLFRHLARRGILIRPFSTDRSWLRFGLPGRESEWARLEAALDSFR